ncbi:Uncharacterized protein Rs2_22435 [Raphanus sativus]|nr:Uncharacterized protein Rs2_22435 [Raphanus sativus]
MSDAPLSIWFNAGTTFEKLTDSVRPIPTELFRFQPHDQLQALANTNKQLPGRCTGPPISAASSLAPGSDLKVDNTCSVGEESPTSDDSLAGHISSEREVALDESALKKARVDESSIFLFSLILFPLKKNTQGNFCCFAY